RSAGNGWGAGLGERPWSTPRSRDRPARPPDRQDDERFPDATGPTSDAGCRGRLMQLNLAYRGRSAVTWSPAGLAVSLAPNLRRDRVGFEGVLRDPLHFREAIGALHDVVISDLRYKPRDKSAYEAYKAQEKRREDELRRVVTKQARTAIHESLPELPEAYSVELEKQYKRSRTTY